MYVSHIHPSGLSKTENMQCVNPTYKNVKPKEPERAQKLKKKEGRKKVTAQSGLQIMIIMHAVSSLLIRYSNRAIRLSKLNCAQAPSIWHMLQVKLLKPR